MIEREVWEDVEIVRNADGTFYFRRRPAHDSDGERRTRLILSEAMAKARGLPPEERLRILKEEYAKNRVQKERVIKVDDTALFSAFKRLDAVQYAKLLMMVKSPAPVKKPAASEGILAQVS